MEEYQKYRLFLFKAKTGRLDNMTIKKDMKNLCVFRLGELCRDEKGELKDFAEETLAKKISDKDLSLHNLLEISKREWAGEKIKKIARKELRRRFAKLDFDKLMFEARYGDYGLKEEAFKVLRQNKTGRSNIYIFEDLGKAAEYAYKERKINDVLTRRPWIYQNCVNMAIGLVERLIGKFTHFPHDIIKKNVIEDDLLVFRKWLVRWRREELEEGKKTIKLFPFPKKLEKEILKELSRRKNIAVKARKMRV
jgi:hypothetical protein